MLQIGRSLVRFQLVSLEFFIDIKSFRSHYGPEVDSASNRNEYQEHFLVVKSGRCVRLTTLPPSCAVVMKSGNLNFLEPAGPLQACNGTALKKCNMILRVSAGKTQLIYVSHKSGDMFRLIQSSPGQFLKHFYDTVSN